MYIKHLQLLRILLGSDEWVTSAVLSSRLGVSVRSIKNYVATLTSEVPGVVESSNSGYRVNRLIASQLVAQQTNTVPTSPKERVHYILTKLLNPSGKKQLGLDTFDFSDELFVSVESIQKDLTQVRGKLKTFNLTLVTGNNGLTVDGKERDKRKLLSKVLYEDFADNIMSINSLQRVFPDYDVLGLIEIIDDKCKTFHYYVSEYSVINMVLDVLIGMHRIRHSFTYARPEMDNFKYDAREEKFAREIANEIEIRYGINYNMIELYELTNILISNLLDINYGTVTMESIEQSVGKSCIELVEVLKEEMQHSSFIDISNNDFMLKFVFHIKNLLVRLQNGYSIKNPLTAYFRIASPLIYECAVGLSEKIKQHTGYYVNEHETAYIAIHIGGSLITHQSKRNKITCVMLFPNYYDYGNQLVKRISNNFEQRLIIKGVATSLRELKLYEDYDLIISTIQQSDITDLEIIYISPFLTDRDISAIQNKITRIAALKRKRILSEQMNKITNPAFFFKNMEFQDRDEALTFMADIMQKHSYVDENYLYEVLERESSYSTAFGNIAVPHSMRMNAKKTGMAVLLNEKALHWGESAVNIVLLFSIKRSERSLFYDIFDNLIVLLLEPGNVKSVMDCETYEEFVEVVLDFL